MDLSTLVVERARIEGDLIMVDEFLNHRVEPDVMRNIGAELGNRLAPRRPDLLLTAEASGIPPAMACSLATGIPMVYAKKYLGTGKRYTFAREVASPTKGVEYRVEVARRVLPAGSRIAIVDDFLAGGRTAVALGEIVEEAGCEVSVFGFVIEKRFAGGRAMLDERGWPVESLVAIGSIEAGRVELA